MRRILSLAAVALGVAVLTVAARFPLSAAVAWAPLSENGVGHGAVEGFLWGGRIHDVRWRRNDFGRVDVAVIRHQVLFARLVAAFRTNGRDVAARGRIATGPSGAVALTRLDADLRVAQTVAGAPVTGSLRILADEIRTDRAGRCLAADGEIRTTVLAESARSFGWDAPDLRGPLTCRDGFWAAALSGERGGVAVTVDAVASGAGVRSAVMTVTGVGADLDRQLRFLGFEPDAAGAALRYEWSPGAQEGSAR